MKKIIYASHNQDTYSLSNMQTAHRTYGFTAPHFFWECRFPRADASFGRCVLSIFACISAMHMAVRKNTLSSHLHIRDVCPCTVHSMHSFLLDAGIFWPWVSQDCFFGTILFLPTVINVYDSSFVSKLRW